MKMTLLLVLDKVLSLFKGKQEHDKEKVGKYSGIVGISFIIMLVTCIFGYFFFPYTFNSDSWPVQFLMEILEYIKNS
ncbi:hypothetical protein [Cetobacterium sp.]|uniref:hypothetical protein n=1 Tax=Cetobacterium sp. TaxID=2071632 RepID=UPI002FC722D7